MSEVSPDMVKAGAEQLAECQRRELSDEDCVIAVYLAMRAVYRMRYIRGASDAIH